MNKTGFQKRPFFPVTKSTLFFQSFFPPYTVIILVHEASISQFRTSTKGDYCVQVRLLF